jgi:hypothetical protein
MNIRIKTWGKESSIRFENKNVIKEINIQEDFMSPKSESIQICFQNRESSGIIEISRQEFDKLMNSVKPRLDAFKFKIIK